MRNDQRIPIGIWSELGPGSRWANEGVSRVFGFIIEGAAKSGIYIFHIVVQRGLAPAVREDLRTLNAVEGRDWLVHEPSRRSELKYGDRSTIVALPESERPLAIAAEFANDSVRVDGWVVSFPHFAGCLRLTQPKAALMPDALPYDFPLGWGGDVYWGETGGWINWRKTATRVLAQCDAVITFSRHVSERHATPLLGVDPAKIHVVPLAPPDLASILPFVKKRRRTQETRAIAAEILREGMANRDNAYLRAFPFEHVRFVVTATQDRPTKNLGLVAIAMRRLVRDRRENIKLFLTAPVHFGADWTLLPGLIERDQFHHDLVSMTDVSREVHAALFHCATVSVHASFFEGIVGALPFYESVSVGTPCVMARGPHIDELLEIEPDLAQFTYDPYDADALGNLILAVESDREGAANVQREAYQRLSRNGWDDVANAYAQAALAGSDRSMPRVARK